jgi:hypothetical protein
MPESPHAIVVFDGECALCNGWVDFLLRFDRRDVFRFTALQPGADASSILLIEGERVLRRSSAVLRILALLGFPFSLAGVFRAVPAAWRDALYDVVARNRIRWFGRRETCRVPSPAERAKFL